MDRAAHARIDPDRSRSGAVAVAAKDRRARLRIAGALAGYSEFAVRIAASSQDLGSHAAPDDVLVCHCETVGAKELALFAQLKSDFPELVIVAVCESANSRTARRAVDGGVDGLVIGERLESSLAPTVAAVLSGQIAVPRELRSGVRKPVLSAREKQILGMVVMGFTNAEIGARLFLAESTVKCHLSSVFTKLGVSSRSEAAAAVLDPQGSLGTGILAITGSD